MSVSVSVSVAFSFVAVRHPPLMLEVWLVSSETASNHWNLIRSIWSMNENEFRYEIVANAWLVNTDVDASRFGQYINTSQSAALKHRVTRTNVRFLVPAAACSFHFITFFSTSSSPSTAHFCCGECELTHSAMWIEPYGLLQINFGSHRRRLDGWMR